jgi:hypothetical protein
MNSHHTKTKVETEQNMEDSVNSCQVNWINKSKAS